MSGQKCDRCHRRTTRTCGLAVYWPSLCGLASAPGRSHDVGDPQPPGAHNPEELTSIEIARAAWAKLPRCGAHARTTGQPCKNPPVRGHHRCRMHGARGGAPQQHGRRSLDTQRARHAMHTMTGVLALFHDKLPPVEVVIQRQDDPDAEGPERA